MIEQLEGERRRRRKKRGRACQRYRLGWWSVRALALARKVRGRSETRVASPTKHKHPQQGLLRSSSHSKRSLSTIAGKPSIMVAGSKHSNRRAKQRSSGVDRQGNPLTTNGNPQSQRYAKKRFVGLPGVEDGRDASRTDTEGSDSTSLKAADLRASGDAAQSHGTSVSHLTALPRDNNGHVELTTLMPRTVPESGNGVQHATINNGASRSRGGVQAGLYPKPPNFAQAVTSKRIPDAEFPTDTQAHVARFSAAKKFGTRRDRPGQSVAEGEHLEV